jgi:penicillin-binding protein 2
MKLIRWLNLILVIFLLTACGHGSGSNGSTPSIPTPQVATTHTPSAEAAMSAYLDALMVEDYATMYGMMTQATRASLSQDDFTNRNKSALAAMSVSKMEYSLLSTLTDPGSAQVAYRLIYHSSLYGDIQRDITAHFSLEGGQWHIQWDDSLILPELAGGNKLVSDYKIPARGDIYDRSGNALVTQTTAVALGLIAGGVPPEFEESLFSELWRLTGVRPEAIRYAYENYPSGLYIPVGEASQDAVNRRYGTLSAYTGLQMSAYTSRYYDAASQAIGYTQAIFPEELDAYRRLGYSGGERVGKIGIEKWGEPYLAGKNGATLYLVDAKGNIGNSFAQTESEPAASIYLTIDKNFQEQAQQAMDGLPGAIVVLERDTGRVLAMVSSPGFDPNMFDPNNYNSMNLANMVNDPTQPLYNRASQGQYPLGSVFKIITMAAALESGVFTPESTYDCQYEFTELGPTHILHDWTWEHCQNELQQDPTLTTCKTKPSGILTLPQGLMRSCDPWFYHIGFDLFNLGKTTAISDMARGFGLGQATGIQQVAESEGQVPVPGDGVQATSLAVGQGNLQVTPLQVADFIAAIGNGGTLYRPQLVEKVQPVSGDPLLVFRPEVRGTLPIKQENLKVIQDAMREVVENQRGTAYFRLSTLNIPMAGKTGTVETGFTEPHAWFAGYTMANNPDKPDIAIAVVVENKGEGSDWAAPIFRRIVEIYFYGKPQSVYWWESAIGAIRTPTPQGQETPTP